MSTEGTGDDQTPRIDYFSKLPYDVLDPIFRLAHHQRRPIRPLSKNLLCFYEENLYRRMYLEGLGDVENFIEHLRARPRLGPLVENLRVYVDQEEAEMWSSLPATNPFISLFLLLPRLKHLNIIELQLPLNLIQDALKGESAPPNLRSLAFPLDPNGDLSSLDVIADLPSVTELYIEGYDIDYKRVVPPKRCLERIRVLDLYIDCIAEFRWLEEVIRVMPNLLHFKVYEESDLEHGLAAVLETLPTNLKVLEIDTLSDQTVDLVLPRFQSLEQLSVRGYAYSNSIHKALLQLPALSHVELSDGKTDATRLMRLLTNPDTLPRLRSIVLDHDGGATGGDRVGSPSKTDFVWSKKSYKCQRMMPRWHLPNWGTPNPFRYRALKGFIDLGKESGIEVSGTGLDNLQPVEHYFIELNNRSVLHAYYEDNLNPLIESRERALKYDYPLPEIDFDSLGPELEIVETPLPDMNWFILSLKNKEEAIHEKEEDRQAGKVEGGDEGEIEEGLKALTLEFF